MFIAAISSLATAAISQESRRSPWMPDYGQAMDVAKRSRRMLVVCFFDPAVDDKVEQRENALFADGRIKASMDQYVWTKIAVGHKATTMGKVITLVDHESFAELRHRPGLAIIDLTDPDGEHFGYVVSIYPFQDGIGPQVDHLAVLLGLPKGSLTQRTLTLAVRIHPERPDSAWGAFSGLLADECKQHSLQQASLLSQGHHELEARFHRINAKLPSGLLAQEVAAESWPGMGLFEAAMDCVRSWRQSSLHWEAVRSRHRLFGYDMKRGSNGVWYATGIFARPR